MNSLLTEIFVQFPKEKLNTWSVSATISLYHHRDIRFLFADNCRHNVFSKNDKKRGSFYTPGFPNGYQPGINCHWRFFGLEFERVQIEFIEFSLNKPPKTRVKLSPTERCLNQDHVKIYKFYYKASIGQVQRDDEAITYCGDDRPISVMSARKARLEMSFVASVSGYGEAKGIHFRYAFLSSKCVSLFKRFSLNRAANNLILKYGPCRRATIRSHKILRICCTPYVGFSKKRR